MRESPSIVPWGDLDRTVYLVLDDFDAKYGWAWTETDVADTDRATLIRQLLEGQYSAPVRVVAFNTAEGWSRDVTEDIANDLQDAWSRQAEIPEPIEEFIREHATKKLARQLSFPI
jgi:hypothetical protein